MHTESTPEIWPWAKWIEGFLLLAVAPFLLFPTQSILATTLALILAALLWLWPLLILRSPQIPSTPFNVALILFCLMVLVAILVTADPQLTLPKATGIIIGLSTWRYIVVYVRQRPQFTWSVAGFIMLGAVMTAIGFLNANWLLKIPSQVPFLQEFLINMGSQPSLPSGVSEGIHPNQIAGTITLYLPLLLSLLVGSRDLRRHKFLFIITLLITFIAGLSLLFTQSRSGWLGIVGGIFALLILWGLILPSSRKRSIVWALTGLLLLLGLFLIIQLGPARIGKLWLDPPQETAVGSLSTLNFRYEIWHWAQEVVRDFPFTGTGLGTFRVVVRRLYPIDVLETFDFAHAHNVFLQMTLDLGIPGLVSYLALLILSVMLGWDIARHDPQLRPVSIGLLAGLCAFQVYGLTDALAIGAKPTLLLWVIFALLATANHISRRRF